MTVSHLWLDGKVTDAENLEDVNSKSDLSYDTESPSFKMLQRCTLLCSIAAFNWALPAEKDLSAEDMAGMESNAISEKKAQLQVDWTEEVKNMKVQERPTVGDASESGLIKFFETIETIEPFREKQPMAETNGIKAEIPFTSANKYKLTIHVPHA